MRLRTSLSLLLTVTLSFLDAVAADFVRPADAGGPLVYGVKNGIAVAIHPFGLDHRERGGPRGLIRVGYQQDGKYHLINYIAVEPVVDGIQGLSELEKSGDGQRGKQFWVGDSLDDGGVGKSGNVAGRIEETPAGQVLKFFLHVEPFANGARPVIEVSLFEKFPNRVRFNTYSGPGGKKQQRCVLTATMGNQSRCRFLWLRSEAVFAPNLYSGYLGTDFVEKGAFRLSDLWQTKAGDVVAAISPDEFEPREVWPLPTDGWHHDGPWMAQFWIKRKGTYDQSLHCRVNGRRVYWAGKVPIPGGIAYENFELREDFRPGQEVWFGYTTQSPAKEFDFKYDAAPTAQSHRKLPKLEAAATAEAVSTARPLTNGDFTAGLDGWQTEGEAKLFQTFIQENTTALTTFGRKKEAGTGRLYQCFKVPADGTELKFLLHGGVDVQKTYVALWQGGQLYRKMTARNDNMPFRVRWDVTSLRGEVVTLEIVDESTAPWGFIGVQEFSLVGKK